jgi:hypothetical protein
MNYLINVINFFAHWLSLKPPVPPYSFLICASGICVVDWKAASRPAGASPEVLVATFPL